MSHAQTVNPATDIAQYTQKKKKRATCDVFILGAVIVSDFSRFDSSHGKKRSLARNHMDFLR